MKRRWVKILAGVLVFVGLPPLLLWWAMIEGKVWPFNDNYYDPYTEIPKSYQRHPDAFQDAAYNMLQVSRMHPDALKGVVGGRGGTSEWHLNRVDPKTGKQATVAASDETTRFFPDVPGVPGGRNLLLYWQHTDPDCVFFFYVPQHREDREKIDALKEKGKFLPASSVVLAYHPAHKPPSNFVDDTPEWKQKLQYYSREREKDPLFMGDRPDWKSKSINPHWTVFYS